MPAPDQRRRLSEQLARLRWQIPVLASSLVLLQQLHEHFLAPPGVSYQLLPELILYALFAPVVIFLAMDWIQRKVELKETAEDDLVQAHAELTHLHWRVSFLLKINQRLAEASDEDELAALALQLVQEVAPLVGSALIRFDQHHQSMPVEYRGELDEATLNVWRRHLGSRAVHHRCVVCRPHSARFGESCPLFESLPLQGVGGVSCLPLTRDEQEFGVLSLYLPVAHQLSPDEASLLQVVAAEISSAFENMRLRMRELATLYEVQEAIHQRLDLDGLMDRILAHTAQASDADAGMLLLLDTNEQLDLRAATGHWAGAGRLPLIESLAADAVETGETVVVGNLKTSAAATSAVLCAPMVADEVSLGVVVLGSLRPDGFTGRQTRLVSAIAGQAALLVENARLYARLEHHAILAERGRLAREMHDGLAQTLGYLKMRSQQIERWLQQDQVDQARSGLRELAQTADEVYLDLRAAIDGLRPARGSSADFSARLRACVTEFETRMNMPVVLTISVALELTPAAQAHALRLVQESLTNIRKHARAQRVWVSLDTEAGRPRLQIGDDGRGFDLAAANSANRHGLNIMRERAGLIGAQLHVHSEPGAGTRIVLDWGPPPAQAQAADVHHAPPPAAGLLDGQP